MGRVIGSVIVGSRVELELVVVIDVLELLELLDDVDDADVLVVDVLLVVGGAVVLLDVLDGTAVEEVLLVLVAVVDDAVLDELVLVDVVVVVGPPASRAGAHRICKDKTVSVSEPN